jgi:Tol biopolymer transport system component
MAGRVWLLDLASKADRPLLDYEVALHSPVWAPDGQRLACISPGLPGIEILDRESGESLQVGNDWGGRPAWSPDGASLVMPDLMLAGEEFVVRLVRVNLQAGAQPTVQLVDISEPEELVREESPAWSPGGGWIAYGRQDLDGERWTPGRQLWLTRPDGSEAYSLVAVPMEDHLAFAWRPDGGALAYAAVDLSRGMELAPDSTVWVFDFEGGQSWEIDDGAVLPKWLP